MAGWRAEDTISFQNPFDLPEGYVYFGDAHLHPGSAHPSALDVDDDQLAAVDGEVLECGIHTHLRVRISDRG